MSDTITVMFPYVVKDQCNVTYKNAFTEKPYIADAALAIDALTNAIGAAKSSTVYDFKLSDSTESTYFAKKYSNCTDTTTLAILNNTNIPLIDKVFEARRALNKVNNYSNPVTNIFNSSTAYRAAIDSTYYLNNNLPGSDKVDIVEQNVLRSNAPKIFFSDLHQLLIKKTIIGAFMVDRTDPSSNPSVIVDELTLSSVDDSSFEEFSSLTTTDITTMITEFKNTIEVDLAKKSIMSYVAQTVFNGILDNNTLEAKRTAAVQFVKDLLTTGNSFVSAVKDKKVNIKIHLQVNVSLTGEIAIPRFDNSKELAIEGGVNALITDDNTQTTDKKIHENSNINNDKLRRDYATTDTSANVNDKSSTDMIDYTIFLQYNREPDTV